MPSKAIFRYGTLKHTNNDVFYPSIYISKTEKTSDSEVLFIKILLFVYRKLISAKSSNNFYIFIIFFGKKA